VRQEFTELSPAERELRGKALLGLRLSEKTYTAAGHALATFVLSDERDLPIFSLEIGDMVSLVSVPSLSESFPTGTVYEKAAGSITVAFGDTFPEVVELDGASRARYELHRSVNRVTYKRMIEALDSVHETQNTRLSLLRDISLQDKEPARKKLDADPEWFDPFLNASQRQAVKMALEAKDVALVHGPPGTGKTTALIEMVRQALARKQTVFLTAPSNTACDNILELALAKGLNVLRIGHPARISEHLREHTLDFKLALHPVSREIAAAEAELGRLKGRQDRYRQRRSPGREEEQELRRDISMLKADIKGLQKEVFQRVMKETELIIGTPAGIRDRSIRDRVFDWVIMDEATQATEPVSWIPVMQAKKLVMAGDHFQLPPTVRSKEAEEKGLGVTLFERFYDVLPAQSRTLLERQYRMNEKIMGFSSKMFYKDLLVADESVRAQTLSGLKGVKDAPETREPLLYIDTVGKGFEEKLEPGSESRYNPEEADLVIEELKKMLALGVPASEIAVICPYSAQVRVIMSKFQMPGLEIDSVDGFQGREKELVLVSLVRSNLTGELGFLNDTRRMNVAMTRARRKLIVVGDSATLSSLPFYKRFIEYAESHSAYKSAWEL
jgi:ATP-dependent RNA/DNA helicase IGHMBP2